jgi:hypothetical protein
VSWENELRQNIRVYVDFSFTQQAVKRELTSVFSSNALTDRKFITDLDLTEQEPVSVKIRVEDLYGNVSAPIDIGSLTLMQDEVISKKNWSMPDPNDSIAGVPQFWGNANEGRNRFIMDDIIDFVQVISIVHTGGDRGRTGYTKDGNLPWNCLIDLGDYYELSRIRTYQHHRAANASIPGNFYQGSNVGEYSTYILNEDTQEWEKVLDQYRRPIPLVGDLEKTKIGHAGDMTYMYPDDPKFTKPTRWIRYEALHTFLSNYTGAGANAVSEITLYGRKANK